MTDNNSDSIGDNIGARPTDQALAVPAEPEDVSALPGFDPSRITAMLEGVNGKLLEPIIRKAADEFYCTALETAQDYLRDNLDDNLKSHISMLERENASLRAANIKALGVVFAARDFIQEGTHLTRIGEYIVHQVIEAADKSDPHYRLCLALEKLDVTAALATEARRAETTQIGSVHEGAGPKDNAHE